MRTPLYSSSSRPSAGKIPTAQNQLPETPEPAVEKPRSSAWRKLYTRHERPLMFLAGALLALGMVLVHAALAPQPPRPLTQEDIDEAVARTLQTQPVPSNAIRA